MKILQNERGFDYCEFHDLYKQRCSLQKSSIATEDCIWLGVDDANPKIMVSDAKRLGLPIYATKENDNGKAGWTKFDVPEEVLLSTRMHLTREQVKQMLPVLKCFVETGELTAPSDLKE